MKISPVSDLREYFSLLWCQARMLCFQTGLLVLRALPNYLCAAVTRAHHVGCPQHNGTAFGEIPCQSSFSRKGGTCFSLLWSNGVKQQKMSINLKDNHVLVIPLRNTEASLKEESGAGLPVSNYAAQSTLSDIPSKRYVRVYLDPSSTVKRERKEWRRKQST